MATIPIYMEFQDHAITEMSVLTGESLFLHGTPLIIDFISWNPEDVKTGEYCIYLRYGGSETDTDPTM